VGDAIDLHDQTTAQHEVDATHLIDRDLLSKRDASLPKVVGQERLRPALARPRRRLEHATDLARSLSSQFRELSCSKETQVESGFDAGEGIARGLCSDDVVEAVDHAHNRSCSGRPLLAPTSSRRTRWEPDRGVIRRTQPTRMTTGADLEPRSFGCPDAVRASSRHSGESTADAHRAGLIVA